MSQHESAPKYTLRTNSQLSVTVGFSSGYVCLTPYVDGKPVPFIYDEQTGDLNMVTPEGSAIKFGISNSSMQVVAIPVRVGNDTQWCNLFLDCPDATPTTMPRNGMWEIRQNSSQEFNGYKTAGEILPFFGADDRTHLGLPGFFDTANVMEFYVREPDPEGTQLNSDGTVINRPGMVAKGASLGAGSPVSDPTISTEVAYQSTAFLLARIKFITPQQALDMIHEEYPDAIIDLADLMTWIGDIEAIKAQFPGLSYLVVKPQCYVDDTVETATGASDTPAI